jgi:hypothetical protein
MDPGTWERIQNTFLNALERDGPERDAWLDGVCADAPDVAREVREMLASHGTDGLEVERVLLSEAAPGGGWSHGDRVGPWTLERLLGQGGMGEVWLARRTDEFEQCSAVTLVRPGWQAAQLVSRFRRERQILARLERYRRGGCVPRSGRQRRPGRRATPRFATGFGASAWLPAGGHRLAVRASGRAVRGVARWRDGRPARRRGRHGDAQPDVPAPRD